MVVGVQVVGYVIIVLNIHMHTCSYIRWRFGLSLASGREDLQEATDASN